MKKIFLFIILGISITLKAQDASVEKSIFSVQTGFAGLWLNNELKLSNSIALRSEIGIEYDFAVGDHYDEAGFILQPVIALEPRFYYNLKKRNANGRKISNNSGNYLSLKTSYHPDWFVINLDDNITKTADLSIIPTWGIKRSIGNHFTYEAAVGLGYRLVFLKANSYNGHAQNVDGFNSTESQYTPYLHLRVGYVF
ncbi:hypothetical protein AAYQ05_05605 [Flavobacterium sp. B11]|uniref:hypothetical protein n=1 Tax=Flavobacterium movens TaxID=214860 RepID=UPI0031E38F16